MIGSFFLLEQNLIRESHAHFEHDGVEYSNFCFSKDCSVRPLTEVHHHYKCSTFINSADGSFFDEKFEISFNTETAEIARKNAKTNGTLPRFLFDITSPKLTEDWTDRQHRTYTALSVFGFYNEVWVVQFLHKDSLKIYRSKMSPYTSDKPHSIYVSSCSEFH